MDPGLDQSATGLLTASHFVELSNPVAAGCGHAGKGQDAAGRAELAALSL